MKLLSYSWVPFNHNSHGDVPAVCAPQVTADKLPPLHMSLSGID